MKKFKTLKNKAKERKLLKNQMQVNRIQKISHKIIIVIFSFIQNVKFSFFSQKSANDEENKEITTMQDGNDDKLDEDKLNEDKLDEDELEEETKPKKKRVN